MQLLHAILFATVHAATTVAGAGIVGAGAPADTYCVVDGESGAESCDTCPQCEGFPGAQTAAQCRETCGARPAAKRYAIDLFSRSRGSHLPVTFFCDDAIEQAEGQFCCFGRGEDSAGRVEARVYCFDSGKPLAKYQQRRVQTEGIASGSGRDANVPFVGGGDDETQRWYFYEESFSFSSDGSPFNSFNVNITISEYVGSHAL